MVINMKKSLAFDMGATSIRGILGYVENGQLKTEEVLRFSHERIKEDGRSRWDWKKIIGNIVNTIIKYKDEIESIGIDTWGVDFGVIDKEGNLLENPISYRDAKNAIGYENAQKVMSLKEIFMNTGNQIMSINTLFQLLTLKEVSEDNYSKIDKLLMMPDLINYFLTGERYAEATIASTTQLFDLAERKISNKILEKFEINKNIFPPVIEPGNIVGNLKNSRIEELRELDIPVISVASHDTASAALLTQAYTDPKCMFLSCGTWSLIGCVTDKPVITEEAYDNSLTNETGYRDSNMFFTNITGLYLVEKLKEQLENRYSRKIPFEEITEYVKSNLTVATYIDVALPVFQQDEFDIISEIDNVTKEHQENDFDYFVIIYKSLTKKYNETINYIKSITKRGFDRLHIIGGGAKSTVLCQMIADETGLDVVVGPFEATAYGNILIQKIAQKEIASLEEGFKIIANTAQLYNYKAKNN